VSSHCPGCGSFSFLIPLHGDKGGPLRCPLCIGTWNAEHGRRRRAGRIVIRALQAYYDAGGSWGDVDKLKLSGAGFGIDALGYGADLATGEGTELTSELLADVLRLVHPDVHPPERKELAGRVTQEMLALSSYVFPAPKPKATAPDDRNGSMWVAQNPDAKPLHSFPCQDCKSTVPHFYCDVCRAEWDKRQEVERERESAKRREWRERRKARIPAKTCMSRGAKFKGKRTDARFCSDVCRQRAHRKAVTAKRGGTRKPPLSRDGVAAPPERAP
jgi:hypothetical protein